jgi:hypothetical protein
MEVAHNAVATAHGVETLVSRSGESGKPCKLRMRSAQVSQIHAVIVEYFFMCFSLTRNLSLFDSVCISLKNFPIYLPLPTLPAGPALLHHFINSERITLDPHPLPLHQPH